MALSFIVPFTQVLQSRLEREFQYTARFMVLLSFGTFLCLAVEAIVPLQSSVFDIMAADQPLSQRTLNFQSLSHQAAASLFLLGSWLFMTLVLYVYRYSPRLAAFNSEKWWRFKAACLAIPALALVISPCCCRHSHVHRCQDMC